jgi:ribosomal-protein-alanine N-acetyltransferase
VSERRVATPADLSALVRMDAVVFDADAWSETSWAGELAQVPGTRHVELLTDDSGGLLGYVVLMVVADVTDIQRIAVAPSARRAGRGRGLLDAALAVARERRCSRVLLEVAADNAPALALYRTAGFEELHRRPGYYGAGRDALVLQFASL